MLGCVRFDTIDTQGVMVYPTIDRIGGKKAMGRLAYRLIEWIDGERGIRLLPYALAERIKVILLRGIK